MKLTGKRTVGLDISRGGLRLAEAHLEDGTPVVDSYVERVLPEGVVGEGVIIDGDQFSAILREAFEAGGFSTRSVAAAAFGRKTVIRDATMPRLSRAETRAAVQTNPPTDDPLPFQQDDAVFDFIPTGDVTAGSKAKVTGILIGAERRSVNSIVRAIRQAGLRPVAIDSGPVATIRAIPAGIADAGTYVLLDIGRSTTSVAYVESGRPRQIEFTMDGGDVVTDRLMERLGLTRGAAEKVKLTRDPNVRARYAEDLDAVLQAAVSDLAWPVQAVMQDRQVDQIVLTGGGSRLEGIERAFADRFKVAVSAPQFTVEGGGVVSLAAVGLSLVGHGTTADLMPPDASHRLRLSKGVVATGVTVAAGAVVFALVAGVTGGQAAAASSRLDRAQAEAASLSEQYASVSDADHAATGVELLTADRSAATAVESDWADIFMRLNALTPSGMTITKFTIDSFGSSAVTSGESEDAGGLTVAITTQSKDIPDLTAWLNSLKSNHQVVGAQVTSSQQEESTGLYQTTVSLDLSPTFTYRYVQTGEAK